MPTLNASRIYRDDLKTVIVVESADIRYEKSDDALGLLAWSRPVAVVVLETNYAHAVDMNAEPVDLSHLLDNAEGLSALLKEARRRTKSSARSPTPSRL